MNPIKTTGIVIRTSNGGDSSKALTVLSPEMGKISVWGRGVRSPKNPMHAGCALLSYNEFILLPRRDLYSLTGCTVLESFYHLRDSVEKLSYATYFADLAGVVTNEATDAATTVRLLLNTLHYIEHDLKPLADLKVLYELRLMSLIGFAPQTDVCVHCGSTDVLFFSPQDGGMVCSSCGKGTHISPAALSLLRRYTQGGLKTALDYDGAQEASLLAPLAEAYVCLHTDTRLKTLEYLKSLNHIL